MTGKDMSNTNPTINFFMMEIPLVKGVYENLGSFFS